MAVFGFLLGQDLTKYQYSLLSAHFSCIPKYRSELIYTADWLNHHLRVVVNMGLTELIGFAVFSALSSVLIKKSGTFFFFFQKKKKRFNLKEAQTLCKWRTNMTICFFWERQISFFLRVIFFPFWISIFIWISLHHFRIITPQLKKNFHLRLNEIFCSNNIFQHYGLTIKSRKSAVCAASKTFLLQQETSLVIDFS